MPKTYTGTASPVNAEALPEVPTKTASEINLSSLREELRKVRIGVRNAQSPPRPPLQVRPTLPNIAHVSSRGKPAGLSGLTVPDHLKPNVLPSSTLGSSNNVNGLQLVQKNVQNLRDLFSSSATASLSGLRDRVTQALHNSRPNPGAGSRSPFSFSNSLKSSNKPMSATKIPSHLENSSKSNSFSFLSTGSDSDGNRAGLRGQEDPKSSGLGATLFSSSSAMGRSTEGLAAREPLTRMQQLGSNKQGEVSPLRLSLSSSDPPHLMTSPQLAPSSTQQRRNPGAMHSSTSSHRPVPLSGSSRPPSGLLHISSSIKSAIAHANDRSDAERNYILSPTRPRRDAQPFQRKPPSPVKHPESEFLKRLQSKKRELSAILLNLKQADPDIFEIARSFEEMERRISGLLDKVEEESAKLNVTIRLKNEEIQNSSDQISQYSQQRKALATRQKAKQSKIQEQTETITDLDGQINELRKAREEAHQAKLRLQREMRALGKEDQERKAKLDTALMALTNIKDSQEHMRAQTTEIKDTKQNLQELLYNISHQLKIKFSDLEHNWMAWTAQDMVHWVCRIEGGKFSRYKDMLCKALRKDGVSGRDIPAVTNSDLGIWGISNFNDRHEILRCFTQLTSFGQVPTGSPSGESDLEEWLSKIGLSSYVQAMQNQGVRYVAELQRLGADELEELARALSMNFSARKRLRQAVFPT